MSDDPWAQPDALDRYRSYLLLLANLARCIRGKVNASDVVQMTLLHAFEKRAQFRGRTEEEFLGWLRAILESHLLQEARKFGRLRRDVTRERPLHAPGDRDTDSAGAGDWLPAPSSSPSSRAARSEQLLALANALATLPADQRRAIELHHLRKRSLAETAAELGRTQDAVAGLLYRGLRQLKRVLAPGSEG